MFKIVCFSAGMLVSLFSTAQLSRKLDSLLPPNGNQPGYALMIEKNGKVLYQKVNGLADLPSKKRVSDQTNFRMASVSKQFIAVAILLLAKENRLTLEDPIGRYLPELPARIGQSVLIRHLLTHTSGVPDYEELIPSSQKKQVLDADVLQMLTIKDSTYFLPGSQFRYSNSGFCLLAMIVERVAHQSFASYIKTNIFLPLKMAHSYVYEDSVVMTDRAMGHAIDSTGKVVPSDQSITSATKGDGGIYTSLVDYRKWVHALQQNKLLNLPDEMQRIRFQIHSPLENYYAAGWFQTGSHYEILFHSGSTCGFNNFVIEVPKEKLTIVFFSNLADNEATFKAIVQVIKNSGEGDFTNVFRLHELTN